MKKIPLKLIRDEVVRDYLEMNSSYKVAKKYGYSATAVKAFLKKEGVLRTQNEAASIRNKSNPEKFGKYKRTEKHKEKLSELAKNRTGEKNPFYGKTHSDETKEKLSQHAKKRTGERNPNYKDGKYLRRPRDYKIHELAPLRNFTFNRDKYTCQYCGQKGGHLHAHHIVPYWVCPEAFLDTDNLTTVCTSCHFSKAHNGNWAKFDLTLIQDALILKYSLNRERLNELADFKSEATVRTPTI
jgi:hypothetical protein